MKVFLILTTGRTGSDYLNYCLDGLNNVITFSGKFKIDDFFSNKFCTCLFPIEPYPTTNTFFKSKNY